MIRAFLIDLDGTLVQSEPLKARAFAEACRRLGGEADPGLYRQVLGTDLATAFRVFTAAAGIAPPPEVFAEAYRAAYRELLEAGVALSPGADELVGFAGQRGLRLALVTSETLPVARRILEQVGLGDAFERLVTREAITRPKPDPEPYLAALAGLQLPAREALAFEDSAGGLRSAARAGCACIALRHGYNAGQDLSLAQQVVTSFTECLARLQDPVP